jgi:hypothetical protein
MDNVIANDAINDVASYLGFRTAFSYARKLPLLKEKIGEDMAQEGQEEGQLNVPIPSFPMVPDKETRRAMGIGIVADFMMSKSKCGSQEIKAEMHARARKYALDDAGCDEVIGLLVRCGYLMELAGDLALTERGRTFFQMARDKIDVADATGSESVAFTEEDRAKYQAAKDDLPG